MLPITEIDSTETNKKRLYCSTKNYLFLDCNIFLFIHIHEILVFVTEIEILFGGLISILKSLHFSLMKEFNGTYLILYQT